MLVELIEGTDTTVIHDGIVNLEEGRRLVDQVRDDLAQCGLLVCTVFERLLVDVDLAMGTGASPDDLAQMGDLGLAAERL